MISAADKVSGVSGVQAIQPCRVDIQKLSHRRNATNERQLHQIIVELLVTEVRSIGPTGGITLDRPLVGRRLPDQACPGIFSEHPGSVSASRRTRRNCFQPATCPQRSVEATDENWLHRRATFEISSDVSVDEFVER